jgi:cyclohexa-1,5-dienecarbonyl-CoA hydratase
MATMVRSEVRLDGGHLRLILDQPKGNIISLALMQDLLRALETVGRSPAIKLVTIEGAGDHFSYGASVEEHRPDVIPQVLPELHRVVRALLAVQAPTAAIVRGRCLGGGFEIALACDLIFASTSSVLGVPEISLGVFPPAAAALLPPRVGVSRAASAILTGEARPVERWVEAGLVEFTAPPQELDDAVDRWFQANLTLRSAAALRCAALASRVALRRHVDAVLPELERFYLDTLMHTNDAVEGIAAFLEKRPPVWSHS